MPGALRELGADSPCASRRHDGYHTLMKAIFFESHGEIDQLKYADLPQPEPKSGEALVRVRAVALNHLDIWVRRGWKGLNLEMPHITGSDVAGEIVSVNASGTTWTPGTRVIINPGITTSDDEWTRKGEDSLSPGFKILGEQVRGGMAEYVCVPLTNLYRLPESVSFEDGAAPLLVGVTCWRMLFKRANLRAGESVLVVGSGGGVNSLSILLAKAAGATVIALSSNRDKLEKAKALGASVVIDYSTSPDWSAEVLKATRGRGVDIVVDNVGAKTFSKSLRSVARGGRIVTVGNTKGYELSFDNRLLFTKQVSLIGSTMGSRQDFIEAMEFLFQRDIRVPIDAVAPLSEGIRMIKRLEDGQQFGKIVLKP
jgi:NADPH:quinone reductase-like Zn-dependent oxidoreductase